VVVWEDEPAEAADCGAYGRIGPVPFHRTGSHTPDGFVLAEGPGIVGGARPAASPLDLGPTLLDLAGAAIPEGLDGAPIPFGA
jgi:hypothetical protein